MAGDFGEFLVEYGRDAFLGIWDDVDLVIGI